jgi:dolichol-phosphate mannosyltransferase
LLVIYFAIPAYNEERTVGVVLWKLRQVMAELGRDYQIIVVDDASTDSTPTVLSPYIRVLPLTVIRNTQRRGYSDSLELAIREVVRRSPYPKRDAVIALQADFTEDPDVVPAMIKRIEAGADVVATDAQIESTAPRSIRWGRRFLRWLLRKPDWAAPGDPLSGLRAYRVVALKRALDARGSTRLLTWDGVGANVELLAQTVPVSRRTDAVETTIKHHRLQRPSRFVFMTAWREVRGAARGKPNAYARPLPVDSAVVSPLPIAVDTIVPAKKKEREAPRRRREPGARPQTAPTRAPRRERSGPKPVKAAPPVAVAAPAVPATDEPEKLSKKRRRSRRRKPKRPQQNTPELVAENAPPTEGMEQAPPEVAANSAEAPPAPKKKSRRGRRGGRGRRRGPRPDANGTETPAESDGEAPPPIAAEGD